MNREKPHVIIFPEDDANRQIVNGFLTHLNINSGAIKMLPVAGGWKNVADKFEKNLIPEMSKYPDMVVILLIDFDEKEGTKTNLTYAKSKISSYLERRVFILGVFFEPEKLKKELGSYESIGEKLAEECYENNDSFWQHPLLNHNQNELKRLSEIVKPIIFN